MARSDPAGETFSDVDWDRIEPGGRTLGASTTVFLALAGPLAAGFLYQALVLPTGYTLVGPFAPSPLDWLALGALALAVSYVGVPVVRRPARLARVREALAARPFGRSAAAFLAVGALLGLVGPLVLGPPTAAQLPFTATQPYPPTSGLPPVGFGVPQDSVLLCTTETRGGRCLGTIRHPLGTTASGKDVLAFVLGGFGVATRVAALTAVVLVPLATLAGTVAAFAGGRVDAVLTRLMDLFQVVPAFLVYLFVRLLYGSQLWLLVVLFGLLGWGGIARRVRGAALSLREAGYVRAAADAGATRARVVARHALPNVSHVAVSGLATELPKLVVVEVTLSYLGVVQTVTPSWGVLIASALSDPTLPPRDIGVVSPLRLWWAVVFPLLALVGTVLSLSVVTDALGDALDPRRADR